MSFWMTSSTTGLFWPSQRQFAHCAPRQSRTAALRGLLLSRRPQGTGRGQPYRLMVFELAPTHWHSLDQVMVSRRVSLMMEWLGAAFTGTWAMALGSANASIRTR